MANCFTNYIGIKNAACEDTPSISGKYINTAAGIDTQSLALLANPDDFKTIIDVWNRIQTRAYDRLDSESQSVMNRKFKFTNLQNQTTFGKTKSPNVALTPSGTIRRGIKIKYVGTPYGVIELTSFKIRSLAITPGVNFEIIDANTGTVLDTITADLAIGENTVPINKTYPADSQDLVLFISYLDVNVQTYQTEAQYWWRNQWYGYETCCENCGCEYCDYAIVNGASFDSTLINPVNANLVTVNETGGIRLTYQVRCSFETFLCENREGLKNIYFKILEFEFWHEITKSSRLNIKTTNKELAAKNMVDLETQIKSELAVFLDGIDLPNDCCFVCNETYSTPYETP